MNQLSVLFLSLLVITCLGPRPQSVGAQSPSGQLTRNCIQSAKLQPRPPQVRQVFPAERSIHTDLPNISAELDLKVGEEVEPDSLKLLIDGIDVTPQAKIGGTRDWPPSSLNISYIMKDSRKGSHCAEVRFRTKKGKINSYQWSFSLKP